MQVTITLKDEPNGGVRIQTDFGPANEQRADSRAAQLAMTIAEMLRKGGAIEHDRKPAGVRR